MLDHQTEEGGAERRADAGERPDEALGQIETARAFGAVGDDQGGDTLSVLPLTPSSS